MITNMLLFLWRHCTLYFTLVIYIYIFKTTLVVGMFISLSLIIKDIEAWAGLQTSSKQAELEKKCMGGERNTSQWKPTYSIWITLHTNHQNTNLYHMCYAQIVISLNNFPNTTHMGLWFTPQSNSKHQD